mmetsp:Transcript_19174/g.29058  ORF Transcript_19174/g.29058 Transcript_19174/m.29058 type:complete len:207 (-) Transcript_19174:121-741(-)
MIYLLFAIPALIKIPMLSKCSKLHYLNYSIFLTSTLKKKKDSILLLSLKPFQRKVSMMSLSTKLLKILVLKEIKNIFQLSCMQCIAGLAPTMLMTLFLNFQLLLSFFLITFGFLTLKRINSDPYHSLLQIVHLTIMMIWLFLVLVVSKERICNNYFCANMHAQFPRMNLSFLLSFLLRSPFPFTLIYAKTYYIQVSSCKPSYSSID